MASRSKQEEVDLNYEFFKTQLATISKQYWGKYALLRDRVIIAFFDTIQDAQTSGRTMYQDGLFSVQKVTDQVDDLGYFSHAVYLGAA